MTDMLEEFKDHRKSKRAVEQAFTKVYSEDTSERTSARNTLVQATSRIPGAPASMLMPRWDDYRSMATYQQFMVNHYNSEDERLLEPHNARELLERVDEGKLAKIAAEAPSGDDENKTLEDYHALAKDIREAGQGKKDYNSKEIIGKIEKVIEKNIEKNYKGNKKAKEALKDFLVYSSRTSINDGLAIINGYIKRETEELEKKYSESERAEIARDKILRLVSEDDSRERGASYIEKLAA